MDDSSLSLKAIQETQDQLIAAFEANSTAFAQALYMLEAHSAVLRRVAADTAKGSVMLTADGALDFDNYLGEYFGVIGLCEFVSAFKHREISGPGRIQHPEEDTIVFGGM